MIIPKEVKELFKKVKYMAFSTSNKKGKPNVVAIGSQKIVKDNRIWIIDTYFDKTKKNILENNQVAIALWETSSNGYQIKGKAFYHEDGDVFEEAKNWILKIKPNKKVKGVVEIYIEEIYSIAAIPKEAGKRLI